MARPKSDDPTVAIMFRMKKSAHDWWVREADKRGIKVSKAIQLAVEAKAESATG